MCRLRSRDWQNNVPTLGQVAFHIDKSYLSAVYVQRRHFTLTGFPIVHRSRFQFDRSFPCSGGSSNSATFTEFMAKPDLQLEKLPALLPVFKS
jgi:hypothetical protein